MSTNKKAILAASSIDGVPNTITPNIPTKHEVLELCMMLGVQTERINRLIKISQGLGEIFLNPQVLSEVELIDLTFDKSVIPYFGGKLGDTQLASIAQRTDFKGNGKTMLFQLIGNFTSLTKKQYQEIFVSRFIQQYGRNFGDKTEIYEPDIMSACILFVKISRSIRLSDVFWKVFDHLVLSALAMPYYFINTTPEIRNQFLKLMFGSPSLQEHFKKPDSFLWVYIFKLFGSEEIVNGEFGKRFHKKIQEGEKEGVTKTTNDTKLSVVGVLQEKKEEKKDLERIIPDEDEISYICRQFKREDSGILHFLESISKIQTLKYQGDFLHMDTYILNMLGSLKGESLPQEYNSLGSDYINMKAGKMSRAKQKRRLSEFVSGGVTHEIQRPFYVLMVLQDPTINIPKNFSTFSFMLFIYPHILNALSPEEQTRFFEIFFKQNKNTHSLSDGESELWKYMLKYFGNIQIISNTYKQLIELLANVGDIQIERTGNILSLLCEKKLPKARKVCLAVYKSTSRGKKEGHPSFYIFDTLQEIQWEIEYQQIVEIALVSKDTIPDIQNKGQLGFREIGLFKKYSEKNDTKTSQVPLRESSLISPEVNVPEVSVSDTSMKEDYEGLETFLFIGEETHRVEERGSMVIFHIDVTEDFLKQYGITHTGLTTTIIFDISGEVPKRESFFGIRDYTFVDHEVYDIFLKKCFAIQERKNKEKAAYQKRALQKVKQELEIPKIFQTALDFLKGCQREDMIIDIQGKNIFIWQIPRGTEVLNSLSSSLSSLGYSLNFGKGENGKLESISIQNIKTHEQKTFSLSKDIFSQDDDTSNANTEDIKMRVYIRAIGAYLAYLGYETHSLLQNKKINILRRLKERETLRKETLKKLQEGKASFINGWDVEEDSQVSLNHPDIEDKAILGRRGGIKIGGNELEIKTQDSHIDEIREEMFGKKSQYLLRYFYARISATLGVGTTKATKIENPTAIKILELYRKSLQDVSPDKISNICLEVFHAFIDANIPLQIAYPVEFSYHELKQ